MLKKLILVAFFAMMSSGLYSQLTALELTFTAENNGVYVQLDSIKVMNRTQGGETWSYWPDSSLLIEINQGDLLLCIGYATLMTVGVPEVNDVISSFSVDQNYPNPMGDRSDIIISIPNSGKVHVMIIDLQGKLVLCSDRLLDEGHHSFRFLPGGGNLYFLTASWNGLSRSIRMISTGQQDGRNCRLDYMGPKTTGEAALKAFSEGKDFQDRQSGILDTPAGDSTYTFQFATNIPCPGTPTVNYQEQVYNTIQVFSQCWLKENLNAGTLIVGTLEQSNNGTIEKYCYNNEPDSCAKYGGLYQWKEMMQYSVQQGTRGICPPGWHLPTDEEWKVLEGAVDNERGIGDPEWDLGWAYRGYDAGTNLRTTHGWCDNGNGTDLFDFSGLPGGYRITNGGFDYGIFKSHWWTSSEQSFNLAWYHDLGCANPAAGRWDHVKELGYSVRCLRDY